jgi:hypothetical protein
MSSVNYIINQLGDLIAPLGKNELVSLIVILAVNEFGKYTFAKTSKTQKGGSIFEELINVILPMSKNDVIVLASILLLNYFNQNKDVNQKSKKIKHGGSNIYGEIVDLLAPLGVNAFGASIVILFLNEIFNKKQKGGSSKLGGSYVDSISELVTPLGVNAFFSVVILTLLSKLFDKASYGSKSGIKEKKSDLRKKLSKNLSSINFLKKSYIK